VESPPNLKKKMSLEEAAVMKGKKKVTNDK
jgi:hypothetical protein